VRTARAKYAVYSAWKDGTIEVDPLDQDFELYDYSSSDVQRELVNVAGPASSLQTQMSQLLQSEVIPTLALRSIPLRTKPEMARTTALAGRIHGQNLANRLGRGHP
jgi:hypothetical protein